MVTLGGVRLKLPFIGGHLKIYVSGAYCVLLYGLSDVFHAQCAFQTPRAPSFGARRVKEEEGRGERTKGRGARGAREGDGSESEKRGEKKGAREADSKI